MPINLKELKDLSAPLDCSSFIKRKRPLKMPKNEFEDCDLSDLDSLPISKQKKIKLITKHQND